MFQAVTSMLGNADFSRAVLCTYIYQEYRADKCKPGMGAYAGEICKHVVEMRAYYFLYLFFNYYYTIKLNPDRLTIPYIP